MKVAARSVLALVMGLAVLGVFVPAARAGLLAAGVEPAETALSLMSRARIHNDQGDHRQAVLLYRQAGETA